MKLAVLLAVVLNVVVAACFLSYTGGLVEGVKMSHIKLPPPSDIGF